MKLRILLSFSALFAACCFPGMPRCHAVTDPAHDLTWALGYDPKTLDPAKVDDEASEQVRYLTAGVLIRLDRHTLRPQPSLATSWKLSVDGKTITFLLRPGLQFSDGSPITSSDVAASLRRVLDPATAAPVAEEFLDPTHVVVAISDALTVQVRTPKRLVSLPAIFDEIAIEPAHRSSEGRITAGPFFVAEYKRGEYLHLQRNTFYRQNGAAAQLPLQAGIRLEIVGNRDTEQLRFLRGQYQLLNTVPPDSFDTLQKRLPGAFVDLGASLNTEQMWFNQSPTSPIPAYKRAWFTSQPFRAAVSSALHREDMVRLAYNGHATPANGFISPANRDWYSSSLPPARTDQAKALQALAGAGFHKQGNQLFDREGHRVSFSLITNTGNHARERMAAVIQQDLAGLGMEVQVVRLDFPALIERLMHSSDYEAALLGLSNVQPDPGSMMNVWLSSSPNHQWNPSEKTPATPWEAEIDSAMRMQAQTADNKARKAAVDRVQMLVAEELPFIYLVYPNVLSAASPALTGVRFSVLQPSAFSNIAEIGWKAGAR